MSDYNSNSKPQIIIQTQNVRLHIQFKLQIIISVQASYYDSNSRPHNILPTQNFSLCFKIIFSEVDMWIVVRSTPLSTESRLKKSPSYKSISCSLW